MRSRLKASPHKAQMQDGTFSAFQVSLAVHGIACDEGDDFSTIQTIFINDIMILN